LIERPYQAELEAKVYKSWQVVRHVLARLDTGGGKTFILSRIVGAHNGASCTMAHRQELVAQLSQALARNGVRHNLIASDAVKRAIIAEHMAEFGRSFFDPGARAAVASVDTLIRAKGLEAWARQVTLVVVDETHHLVMDNKWHTALLMFTHPELRVLGLTATPARADGQGLGDGQDGIYHEMVQGPAMRWLIDQGYLTDYDVVCPESDMELLESDIGAGGDWSTAKLREAARASHIVGDVVAKFREFSAGAPAVTFCPDTETAADICTAFNAAGIRAALLTGKTDGGVRRATLRKLAAGDIQQLVVVDIVSEGFDLPALITGSMVRKTNSLALFMQQFGRLLRPMYAPGYDLATQAGRLAAIAAGPKPRARLIDHVGNFLRHGPPDRERPWTLNRRDKRAKQNTDSIPYRVCTSVDPVCAKPYEAFLDVCPYCGTPRPEPAARSAPSMVDGVMRLLDAETIDKLRGAIAERDLSPMEYMERMAATGMPAIGIKGHTNTHMAHQAAQQSLRQVMALWGGGRHAAGRSDSEIQREFFWRFGTSVLEAQALGRADAEALTAKIGEAL
jgi:DNA repair protein RadD